MRVAVRIRAVVKGIMDVESLTGAHDDGPIVRYPESLPGSRMSIAEANMIALCNDIPDFEIVVGEGGPLARRKTRQGSSQRTSPQGKTIRLKISVARHDSLFT